MAVEVVFPLLGLEASGGRVVRWLKEEGAHLQKGDILAEIETEKVLTEVESPASGVLRKILVREGAQVPTFAVLAIITAVDEELPDRYLTVGPPPEPVGKARVAIEATPSRPAPAARVESARIVAVPSVRKLASDLGVVLSLVAGTGPGGRILREDVLRAVEESKGAATPSITEAAVSAEEEVAPLSLMRKVIAERMTDSFKTPHFYLSVEVDTWELGLLRERLMPGILKETGVRLTYTDLVAKLASRALLENPSVNCAYTDGSVKLLKRIDIGLVTAVEGGLVVPVIRGVDKKSLSQIVKSRDELVRKARERRLTREEMTGSTFTISNLGMYGIDQFCAILQPPEAAILAIGRIADKAVVRAGQITVRPMMTLTLSVDHRVLDGVIGARFLQTLKNHIETAVGAL